MHTGRPRRFALPTLAATTAALAVAALTSAACDARPARANAPSSVVVAAANGPSTVTTGAALAGYRWQTLPDAPVTARDDAVGVWTGSQLLVWGGDINGHRYFANGAAYNPDLRTWTRLPHSPLSARANPAYVWTGSQLLIWGGTRGSHNLTDGALYNPRTRQWTKLPKSPVPSYGSASAYRVGSRVVLVTTPPARWAPSIRAAVLDPATATWSTLPSLHLSKHHRAYSVIGVSAGQRVFLWSAWAYDQTLKDGSGEVHAGVAGYTLRPGARSWSRNKLALAHGIAYQAFWTGKRVLLPSLDIWCGICPHPMAVNRTGLSLDPANGSRSTIAHGPVDDLGATYVWTGSALLGLDTTTEISGGGRPTYPGEAAAWNPRTHRWTTLASAPLYGGESAVHVWTGFGELVWGRMYNRHSHLSTHSGLEFAASYVR
jgi:hypothetical protein